MIVLLLYLFFAIAIVIFLLLWKNESKFTFVISPFLIFSIYCLMGILTCINAYQNKICESTLPFWIYFCSYLVFSAGFFLHKNSLQFKKGNILGYKSQEFEVEDYNKYFFPLIVLTLIMIGVGLYLYKGIPMSIRNLISLFKGDLTHTNAVALTEFRRELTKSYYFGGEYNGSGMLRTVLRYGWEFIDIVAVTLLIKDKERFKRNLAFSIIAIVLSYIFVSGDGTRFSILRVLLAVIIAVSILKNIKIGRAIRIIIILLVLMVIVSSASNKMYSSDVDGNGFMNSFMGIIDRIMSGNQINDVYVIDWYSKGLMDFYHGKQHYIQLVNALPGSSTHMSFSYEIARMYGAGSDTTYMSPTYLSILYADFGVVGALIGYYLIGALIPIVECYLYKKTKNVFWFTVTSIFILELGLLIMTGFVKIIPDIVVIIVICLLYKFLLYLTKKYSGKKRRMIIQRRSFRS